MKKRALFITVFLGVVFYVFPQAGVPEFGNITTADLTSKECSFEKDAPAYYMVNYAKTEFNLFGNGYYNLITTRRIRIKIVTQKGFEYASILIPHFGNKHTSKITDIEAFIYTLDSNGAIVKNKVDKDDIFKTTISKKDDLNAVKFTFPGLKPGCIIEYRYEHLERNTYDIAPWFFQNKIPVALSYCEIIYPDYAVFDYRLIGQLPVDENNYKEWPVDSTKKKFRKVFLMKDIRSFKAEPLMSSAVDNLKRIEFSLNPDPGFQILIPRSTDMKWRRINTKLNVSMNFGMQYNIPIPGTEKLVDSVKLLQSKKDRISAVYQYVRKQVSWDKHQTMYPYDINEVWNTKTGNSAEINMIILNLLGKTGIECYPILISTRENGKTDPLFAHMSQFNGLDVIVIDSTDYYILDGSSKNQSCFIPPLNILNRDVFLSAKDECLWMHINEKRPLIKDSIYITAALDKQGNISGESVTTSFNYSRDLRLSEQKDADKNTNDLLSDDAPELKMDSSWMINKENSNLPLVTHTKFHLLLNNTNNFYFLSAFLFNSIRKNPFVDSTRSTSVDFMCNQQYTQVVNISLPPEIVLENIPKSTIIRMIDTSMVFSRKVIQLGSVLHIENEFTISKSTYSPDEYTAVWQFFKKVYALLTEEVILNKK